jgi:hypothetical protein
MIKVIDSLMGTGKTSFMIGEMNNSENNFIYITPYLDECSRIKEECKARHFITPDEKFMGNKTKHFKFLISKGKNIVSTHSLFKGADSEVIELLNAQNYVLVLDEVLDVVEPLNVSKKDLKEILERYAHIDELTQELVWDDRDYTGNHYELMQMAINSSLLVINNVVLLWNFPIEIFKGFKDVYILTYLFDYQIQKYYYDYYGITYDKFSIDRLDNKSVLVNYGESNFEKIIKENISKLINIYDGKLNNIGDIEYSLSKSWFDANKGSMLMERLQKNIYTYFCNNIKTRSKLNGWTTFKGYKKDISGAGYARGFIPINMRASNEYKHKESLAYVGNRFMNPFLKLMFSFKKVKIDEDMWALSEMLQWLWRGCVRDNNIMNVYIPSKRMRLMLQYWMEGKI